MPSHRKRKREAASRDMTVRELELVELLEEVLDSVRWLQILGYSNQYLLERHLQVDPVERDRILDAAVRTVDKDKKLHEWQERLARIKEGVVGIQRGIRRARKELSRASDRRDADAESE